MYVSSTPLTTAQIKHAAPAVFGHSLNTLSDNYGFIGTSQLIDFANDLGFKPVQVSQVKSRSKEKTLVEAKRHLVRFRHQDDVGEQEAVDILFLNSHDGTSSLQMRLGIFRAACANGLVVGNTMSEVRANHLRLTEDVVKDSLTQLFQKAPLVLDRVHAMKEITIDREVAIGIAKDALNLRLNEPEEFDRLWEFNRRGFLHSIDNTRRYSDMGAAVWPVYNRFQENIHGGISYWSPANQRIVHSRKVTSMQRSIELSKQIDDLFMNRVPELASFREVA